MVILISFAMSFRKIKISTTSRNEKQPSYDDCFPFLGAGEGFLASEPFATSVHSSQKTARIHCVAAQPSALPASSTGRGRCSVPPTSGQR